MTLGPAPAARCFRPRSAPLKSGRRCSRHPPTAWPVSRPRAETYSQKLPCSRFDECIPRATSRPHASQRLAWRRLKGFRNSRQPVFRAVHRVVTARRGLFPLCQSNLSGIRRPATARRPNRSDRPPRLRGRQPAARAAKRSTTCARTRRRRVTDWGRFSSATATTSPARTGRNDSGPGPASLPSIARVSG